MFRLTRLIPTLILTLVLAAACTAPPPRAQFPDLRYTHLPPLTLAVADVEAISRYRAPFDRPNVEHLMPLPPEKAALTWGRDRLAATGNGKTGDGEARARFVVDQAPVVVERLETETGVTGLFKTEQAVRYTATLEAGIEILGPDGRVAAAAYARAERSQTAPEGLSINEREGVWFRLVQDLMKDFTPEMERQAQRHLSRYLR